VLEYAVVRLQIQVFQGHQPHGQGHVYLNRIFKEIPSRRVLLLSEHFFLSGAYISRRKLVLKNLI
jgi:hypothetical protein